MRVCADSLEVMEVNQKLRHGRGLTRVRKVRDLARIFAAAVAVSMVIAALMLMIYWIQSVLELPKHLLAAILIFLEVV